MGACGELPAAEEAEHPHPVVHRDDHDLLRHGHVRAVELDRVGAGQHPAGGVAAHEAAPVHEEDNGQWRASGEAVRSRGVCGPAPSGG